MQDLEPHLRRPTSTGAGKAAATVGCCPQSSSVSHVPLGMTFWGPACNMPGFPLQPLGILSCCQCPNFARCFSAGPCKGYDAHSTTGFLLRRHWGLAEDTPSCWRTCGGCKADGLLCHRACTEMCHLSFPITFPPGVRQEPPECGLGQRAP